MTITPAQKHTAETADLLNRVQAWRRFVSISNPLANGDHIRILADGIVFRAQQLAADYPVRFYDVALFLLERTQGWVMNGTPLDQIGPKLPKNLDDLGVLIMSEGSQEAFGAPLSAKEMQAVVKASKQIVH